jgi:magnesium chelatase subunit I
MEVIVQEAVPADLEGLRVDVPTYMAEIVATLSQLARQSPQVNQRSGVSVRLGVANYETLVAAAARRALRTGEDEAVPRVSDLAALVSSTAGKVELDSLEDDAEGEVVARLTRQAVLAVFRDRVDPAELAMAVAELDDGKAVEVGDDLSSSSYVVTLGRLAGLRAPTLKLAGSESPAALAAAAELVLEGLHLSKRLNKHSTAHGARYQSRRTGN